LQQIDGQGQHDNGQHTKRGRMRCGVVRWIFISLLLPPLVLRTPGEASC
jgi:hypothetical protein